MVAAPHNNKQKSITGDKNYNGVGGHLLAVAADKSKEFGYQGCISAIAASDEILQHYIDNAILFSITQKYISLLKVS